MKEELIFCPLGGSGEIGMNMNLFAYGKAENQKWIIDDIGVTFADDTVPGVDLIYPDPGFIVDKKDDLLGIVLTHAHEDHISSRLYEVYFLQEFLFLDRLAQELSESSLQTQS